MKKDEVRLQDGMWQGGVGGPSVFEVDFETLGVLPSEGIIEGVGYRAAGAKGSSSPTKPVIPLRQHPPPPPLRAADVFVRSSWLTQEMGGVVSQAYFFS